MVGNTKNASYADRVKEKGGGKLSLPIDHQRRGDLRQGGGDPAEELNMDDEAEVRACPTSFPLSHFCLCLMFPFRPPRPFYQPPWVWCNGRLLRIVRVG